MTASPPGYARLLRENPNLRRLWYGQVVSQMGDWFSGVAVAALLIERSGAHAGTAIAAYALSRHVPILLLGPAAGIAADRLDRRRLLIGADLARAALALGYLGAWAGGSLWLLYVVTAGLSGVSTFFNTARGALLPALASRSQLLVANALSAATFGSTLAVGSLLGGLLSAMVGRAPAFALNALSFLISAAFIAGIRMAAETRQVPAPPARPAGILSTAWGDLREGLGAVRACPTLWGVLLLPAGWALGTGAARTLYSLYGAILGQATASGLARNPRDFGIAVLFAAMGIGSVLGTFLARRLALRQTPQLLRAIAPAVLLDGLGLAALGLSPSLAFAAAVLLVREVGYALWWTSQQTLVMLLAPGPVRGRVIAAQESLTTLALILSMAVAGPAIDAGGLRTVAFSAGGVIVAAALAFGLWRRREQEQPAARE